jgi:hypothetical protein
MPNRTRHYSSLRVDKTTKRGTFRGITKSKAALRIEIYGIANKLAWEQIPPNQKKNDRIYLCAYMLLSDGNLRRERRMLKISCSRHSKRRSYPSRIPSSATAP